MKENSRFKFRAWDYENKQWVYGYYTKLVEGIRKYDAIVSEDGGSLVRYYIKDIKTLGQYTGLKDKNGVEIYDGDILQFNDCFLDNTKPLLNIKHLGRIEATAGGFVFVRQYWWNDPFYPEMGEALADMQTKSWIRSNCEIIGNIYENPELLEDKQ